MHDTYTLFGTQGCGSTIVAAALALTAFPWGYEEVDYTQDGPERDRLLALNPLGQVPTLVLPNDEVMTESAAIILLLHDRAPHAELAPPGGSPLLPRFCAGCCSSTRRFTPLSPMPTIRSAGSRRRQGRNS